MQKLRVLSARKAATRPPVELTPQEREESLGEDGRRGAYKEMDLESVIVKETENGTYTEMDLETLDVKEMGTDTETRTRRNWSLIGKW